MSEPADIAGADGRSLVVLFVVEGRGEWLVWGTGVVKDGQLSLSTDEADTLVPLPGATQRLRRADDLSFADGAEYVTAVHVGTRPGDVRADDIVSTGLRFE